MSLFVLLNRRWWWVTILVILATGVLARLGKWQLDRLDQRRAFNAHVIAQTGEPKLILTNETANLALSEMEYRSVEVTGEYDSQFEVALRNQVWNGQPGYRLITPLKILGSDLAVLVNRGWVPTDTYTPGDWEKYAQTGLVTIDGIIRESEEKPDFGGRLDPTPQLGEKIVVWNLANLMQIQKQIPYPILPVYIQRAPDDSYPLSEFDWSRNLLPFPGLPNLEISEGPHLGYAIQWFTFATILILGYPFFVLREERTQTPKQGKV